MAEKPQSMSVDELAELRRLGEALVGAASAGDIQALGRLLGARAGVLDRLRGRRASPEMIRTLLAVDAQTTQLVRDRLETLSASLAHCRQGRRALAGYSSALCVPQGFLDRQQ